MVTRYRVYSIIERQRQADYWLPIGVAFPHEDGKGFNVLLQALPLHGNGKLVLREQEETNLQEAPITSASADQPGNRNGRYVHP